MMIIVIGLFSKEVLEDLRTRFNGITPEVERELHSKIMADTPCPGVLKRFPKAPGADIDSRYATRTRRGLELLAALEWSKASEALADASCGAALFFSPLVPRYYDGQDGNLNDIGGQVGGGPVLSPQRCGDLLGCFRSVDLRSFEAAINENIALIEKPGPAYTFKNGAHLIAYLRSYASILEEATTQQMFYMSFFA
jgi:hypothetical protein